MSSIESNLASMAIEDSDQPAVSSEDANPATTSSEDAGHPDISAEDSNRINATALSLITDLHTFLATTPNDPAAHALITPKWALITETYHLSAAFVRAYKASLGGSWPADNTPPTILPTPALTDLSRRHDKASTAFIAACRDFIKHSRSVESLSQDVLAVPPGTDQENLLLRQVFREQPALGAMDRKCKKLKARMMKLRGKRNAARQAAEDAALWERHDPVLREFLRVHARMEEVEGVLKGFLGLGGEGGLGDWRVWPGGEGSVVECLVRHVHMAT